MSQNMTNIVGWKCNCGFKVIKFVMQIFTIHASKPGYKKKKKEKQVYSESVFFFYIQFICNFFSHKMDVELESPIY